MSQTTKIFVFICLAFIVYIASKGNLKSYLSFFSIGGSSANGGTSAIARDASAITSDVKGAATITHTVEQAYQAVVAANGQQIAVSNDAIAASGDQIAAAIAASGIV